MAAIFVVVVEVSAHKPDKMMPVKDDHVIEHLPSAAADPSFRDSHSARDCDKRCDRV